MAVFVNTFQICTTFLCMCISLGSEKQTIKQMPLTYTNIIARMISNLKYSAPPPV